MWNNLLNEIQIIRNLAPLENKIQTHFSGKSKKFNFTIFRTVWISQTLFDIFCWQKSDFNSAQYKSSNGLDDNYRVQVDPGASFQLFLVGANFKKKKFSMPPDYWKIEKNSTLYVVIWRLFIVSFFISFFLLFSLFFFFFFFFLFSLGGRQPPQMTPLGWPYLFSSRVRPTKPPTPSLRIILSTITYY